MAKYRIYVVKLGSPRVGSETNTGNALKGYFDQVIQSNAALQRRFNEGAEVQWLTRCPGPAPHEVAHLCCLLGNGQHCRQPPRPAQPAR